MPITDLQGRGIGPSRRRCGGPSPPDYLQTQYLAPQSGPAFGPAQPLTAAEPVPSIAPPHFGFARQLRCAASAIAATGRVACPLDLAGLARRADVQGLSGQQRRSAAEYDVGQTANRSAGLGTRISAGMLAFSATAHKTPPGLKAGSSTSRAWPWCGWTAAENWSAAISARAFR